MNENKFVITIEFTFLESGSNLVYKAEGGIAPELIDEYKKQSHIAVNKVFDELRKRELKNED